MYKAIIRNNNINITIILFLVIFISFIYFKPGIIFNNNGLLRNFGFLRMIILMIMPHDQFWKLKLKAQPIKISTKIYLNLFGEKTYNFSLQNIEPNSSYLYRFPKF